MSIYVYNSTISTNTYTTEDYGTISSSVTESVDYSAGLSLPSQTVVDYSTYNYFTPADFSSTNQTFDSSLETFDVTIYENFGNIYDNSTITPFGSLDLELTSGVISEVDVYVASGTLFNVGVLSENVTFAWVGSGTVFEIGGGLERTVKPYIASGTLRMDAGAAATALKSLTKSYNISSIYNPDLDWGSISSYVLGGDDFGLITEQPLGSFPYDDFGLVSDIATSYPLLPFGRFRFVSYSVDNSYDTCDIDGISCDSGTSANVSFTANTPDQTILYTFSGVAVESETDSYIGIGTLTSSGVALESETDVYIGFGTLTSSGVALNSETNVYIGFGTQTLSGTVLESFSAQTPEDTQLFSISGKSIESFSANTPDNIQLFSIFGQLVHPNIDYTPHYGIDQNIGIGTTGIKLRSGVFPEKFAFSYNQNTPCYDSIAQSLDFGLLTGTPIVPTINLPNSDFFDYGLVSQQDTGNIPDNFGWITEPLITVCPFGSTYLSGTSIEKFTANTPENTQLFSISGFGTEAFSAQTPEDTILYTFSGSLVEKNTESYVGSIITLSLSGTGIESFSADTPDNTQLFTISGFGIESFSADTPDNTQLFTISGFGTEAFSAQTPEDTILYTFSGSLVEKNTESYVGIGTLTISGSSLESFSANTPEDVQLFSISGTLVEKNTESYVGIQTVLTLSGTALESFSAQTPEDTILYTFSGSLVEKNTESYVGIGSFGPVPGVGFEPDGDGNLRDAKTYSNRYGFQIGDFNLGSGIGTIRIDGIARTRLALPYFAQGSFFVSGNANESFCRTTYNGFEILTISGISSTREIAVYGYYGDDNNPGTSGTIFVSQQTSPTIEINVDNYTGSGQLSLSGNSEVVTRNSFFGSGFSQFTGTALESFSAQTPEDVQLFSISGIGLEVYSAQTPETEVLYIINGFIEESITNNYEGSGSTTLSGNSSTFYVPNYPARGSFRFRTHNSDNDYDTCDNEEITCDKQDSAYVSFTANPPENTILFNFGGNAVTAEIATYTAIGSGSYTLFGTYQNIKLVHSEIGIGTIFIAQTSSESERDVYVGSGNLFTISGSSESYSAQTPENTILFQISGSAATSVEFNYPVVGIGLFSLSGSAITSEIATYTQVGSGNITLSGELLYPNVVYIPSPDGSGLINVLGSSNNSITKLYDKTSGSLFGFSSGQESFTKSTYVGVGTIYIQDLSASTINNPFQIPRTYVVII